MLAPLSAGPRRGVHRLRERPEPDADAARDGIRDRLRPVDLRAAPAVAEWLSLGPKAIVALGVLIAVIGGDVVGGLLAASASFKRDPLGSFKGWWGAWWNRGGQS